MHDSLASIRGERAPRSIYLSWRSRLTLCDGQAFSTTSRLEKLGLLKLTEY